MVTISIFRKNTLNKTVGYGRGKIIEGTITAVWDDVKNIEAASFGLKSLSRLTVTTGTPLEAKNYARINAPGSMNNEAQVRSIIEKRGSWARFGTPKYIVFATPTIFVGTPNQVMLTPGSPLAAPAEGSATYFGLRGHTSPGSFSAYGTPTFNYGYYLAFGYGSYPLGFIAVGD